MRVARCPDALELRARIRDDFEAVHRNEHLLFPSLNGFVLVYCLAKVTTTPVAASSGWSKGVLKWAATPGGSRGFGGSMILNWTSLSAASRNATRSRGTSCAVFPLLIMSPSMIRPSGVRDGTSFSILSPAPGRR